MHWNSPLGLEPVITFGQATASAGLADRHSGLPWAPGPGFAQPPYLSGLRDKPPSKVAYTKQDGFELPLAFVPLA